MVELTINLRRKIHDQILDLTIDAAHRGEVATASMPLYNQAEGEGAEVLSD
jgi:hypothetical protein